MQRLSKHPRVGCWLIGMEVPPAFSYVEGQTPTPISFGLNINRLFRSGDHLFGITDQNLVEINLQLLGKPLLTAGSQWRILPDATHWFENIAVTDMLGAAYIYLPLTEGGMVQVRVKELEGLTPIEGEGWKPICDHHGSQSPW